MHTNIETVNSGELFKVILDLMQEGKDVDLTVTGSSMTPFIWQLKDSVVLRKIDFEQISFLDIVLVQRDNGQYILHRVCKKDSESFYLIGDAQDYIEGPLRSNQLLGKVIFINKKKKYKSNCNSLGWKCLAFVWLLMRPFRSKLLNVLYKCKCTLKGLLRVGINSKKNQKNHIN